MPDVRLALVQARYALLTTLRTPRTVVFSIAFPVVLLVLFDGVFTKGADDSIALAGGRITASAYFTAAMMTYAIGLQAFSTIVIGVTTQRESGQLKRMRATPMPAWTFVAGQVLRSTAVGAAVAVALVAIGVLAFGVDVRPERLPGIAVFVALGTVVFCALGLAATAYTPTVDSASTVGPFAIVMLAFVSGVFVSVDQLPGWLESIGRIFPLEHLADGLQRTLVSGGGGTLDGGDLVVLLGWGVAGLALARRRFRWEPQGS